MRTLIATLALALALPAFLVAGGRLDKFGGQLNHKTGQYHFYRLNGRKLAKPLDGENPNTNGGKIVYSGVPQYADDKATPEQAASPAKVHAKKARKPKRAAAKPADAKASKKASRAAKKAAKRAAKKAKKAKKSKAGQQAPAAAGAN